MDSESRSSPQILEIEKNSLERAFPVRAADGSDLWKHLPIVVGSENLKSSEAQPHIVLGSGNLQSLQSHAHDLVGHGALSEEAEPVSLKQKFSQIYDTNMWGTDGRGSGTGSSMHATEVTRAIVRMVVANFSLHSMTDAPCGGMEWQPFMLDQIQEDQPQRRFKYLGLDIVDSVIEANSRRFVNNTDWRFKVANLATDGIPSGSDLILTRDALQHLPCLEIVSALENISKAKPKYVLAGSYESDEWGNRNIKPGDYFAINLREFPFNLSDGVLHVYNERSSTVLVNEPDKKLLLFSGGYLRNVDYEAMKGRCPA